MKIRLILKGDAVQIGVDEFYNPWRTVDIYAKNDLIDVRNEHIVGAVACAVGQENDTSAQPEQRWMPISERLPEKDVSVLASIKNHSFEVAVGEIDGEVFWLHDGFIPLDDVIAWMPLPEPYRGGK